MSEIKFKQDINLDILKRLNYIYETIISKEKTLEYSKKLIDLLIIIKKQNLKLKQKIRGLKTQYY